MRAQAKCLASALESFSESHEAFGARPTEDFFTHALDTQAKCDALVFAVKSVVGMDKSSDSESKRKRFAKTQLAKLERDDTQSLKQWLPPPWISKLEDEMTI